MNILGCRFGAPACGADGSLEGFWRSRVRFAGRLPSIHSRVGLVTMSIAALALAACGGGGGGGGGGSGSGSTTPPPAATTYTIGGSVTGLSGTLVLQDNGGNNLTVTTAGNFTFSTQLASGAAYSVTVLTQPSGQTCTVANGSGTVSANVTNVAVSCASSSTGLTIGGTVSRLAGSGLVLQDNGGDNLTVTANGSFTFKTSLAAGAAYAVTVSTQPSSPTQYCVVTNGGGTVASANVTSVMVMCAQFAYTANNTDGTIDAYTIDPTSGVLTGVSGNPYPDGTAPAAVSLAPNGMFAFSASNDGKQIYAYAIDQTSGQLNPVPGSPFNTGFTVGSPYPDIAVDAQSAHLYLASAGDGKVAGFAIDASSGALTPLTGSPYQAGTGAGAIPAFSPGGGYLYVMNQTANTVSGYSIDATTGVLTPLTTPTNSVATGTTPSWIAFTPDGKYAYVSDSGEDAISQYSVSSGVLTPMTPATVATDELPQDLTINANGTYLYAPVANGSTPGAVEVYSIGSTGALTAMSSTPAGVKPVYLAIDPAGPYAYVSSSAGAEVYGYSISSTTGALTALANSPFSTGAGSLPQFITIDPSGRFGYTANEGTANITGFTISSTTGELTAMPSAFPAGTKPIFVSISPEVPGIRD
jgi:6-phosphogluconolactonase (cycloisomerase 2 family)